MSILSEERIQILLKELRRNSGGKLLKATEIYNTIAEAQDLHTRKEIKKELAQYRRLTDKDWGFGLFIGEDEWKAYWSK